MKKYCLALDLVDNQILIDEYERWHQSVWEEIKSSIKHAGILDLEIYRYANRLFMIITSEDDFSFDKKARMDALNPTVQEWEQLMWKYQKPLPGTKAGEKWMLMDNIFSLNQ